MKKSKLEERDAAKLVREEEKHKTVSMWINPWWLTAPRPHAHQSGTRQNRRRRHARQAY